MADTTTPDTSIDLNALSLSSVAQKASPEANTLNAAPVAPAPVAQESIMGRLNSEAKANDTGPEIKLDQLTIAAPTPSTSSNKVILGDSGIQINFAKKTLNIGYLRLVTISSIVAIVCGLASIGLRFYDRYLYFSAQPVMDTTYATYIDKYTAAKSFLDSKFHLSNYANYSTISMLSSGAGDDIDRVLQAQDIDFVQKKNIFQNALNTFSASFIDSLQKSEAIKQEVSQYGFFSKDLYALLQDQEYATSIKDSLLSLEMIKFSSAMKVFSYLESFVSGLGNILGTPASQVAAKMTQLTQRREKDILIYLNNCYLNPYEVDYDCNLVGDFDRYYKAIDTTQSSFDTTFFKKLMSYVDTKLEQKEMPSFAITFQKFDPTQKEINFKVDVNTLQSDEEAMIQKGIVNPHIFVVTNLLNLIKQSLFVISANIDTKSLKIVPKTVKVGSTVFNFNSSSMSFVLPIQESTQREISDYTNDLLPTAP